jgi:hypothetical protein
VTAVRVRLTVVGDIERRTFTWPPGFAIPAAGDEVLAPWGGWLKVRRVCWYPFGDREDDPAADREPFVYLVLAAPAPLRLAEGDPETLTVAE